MRGNLVGTTKIYGPASEIVFQRDLEALNSE